MSDENGNPEVPDATPQGNASPPSPPPEAPPEDPAERGLLAEVQRQRQKRQELAQQLEALKAQQAEAARKAAEKAGKFRELYEDLKPKAESWQAKIEQYEAEQAARAEKLTARNTERLSSLPEHLADVVKALPDGTAPEVIASQLDRLEKLRDADSGVHNTVTRGGQGGITLTKAQEAFRAKWMPGATDEAVIQAYKALNPE